MPARHKVLEMGENHFEILTRLPENILIPVLPTFLLKKLHLRCFEKLGIISHNFKVLIISRIIQQTQLTIKMHRVTNRYQTILLLTVDVKNERVRIIHIFMNNQARRKYLLAISILTDLIYLLLQNRNIEHPLTQNFNEILYIFFPERISYHVQMLQPTTTFIFFVKSSI